MPPIRSQHVDASGIRIVASDGRELRITPAELLERFNASAQGRRPVDPGKDLRENIETAKLSVSGTVRMELVLPFLDPPDAKLRGGASPRPVVVTFNADTGEPTGLVIG